MRLTETEFRLRRLLIQLRGAQLSQAETGRILGVTPRTVRRALTGLRTKNVRIPFINEINGLTAEIRSFRPLYSSPVLSADTAQQIPADQSRKPPAKEHRTTMQMPAYYTSSDDQKLWRMAARWIIQNNPDLGAYTADRCAPIMELLERAGAANLPEDAPLPAISWPPADLPKIARPSRKPAASADLLRLAASVKSQIG